MKKKKFDEQQEPLFPEFKPSWIKDINPVSQRVKKRRIGSPNKAMRKVQKSLSKSLRRWSVPMPSSKGGGKGHSPIKNVRCHLKRLPKKGFNRFLYLLDLSNAFHSVQLPELAKALAKVMEKHDATLNTHEKIVEFLKKNCHDKVMGGIIVGGNASQDLFNLYCEVVIDRQLREVCKVHGITYTRYIDDLTFSSARPIGLRKRRKIRKIITDAAFRINNMKTSYVDLRKGPACINGIGICLDGRMFLPRHALVKLKGLLHRAITKKNVPKAKVFGTMGIFLGLTKREGANRTEEKIFALYDEFKKTYVS